MTILFLFLCRMGLNKKIKKLFVAILDNRVIFAATNIADFRRSHNELFPDNTKSYTFFKSNFDKENIIKLAISKNEVLVLQKVK